MKTNRPLFLTLLIVAMASLLLIAGTFALFTDTATVQNHLQAGTLDITLVRTKLVTYAPNDDGLYVTVTDDNDEDFTDVPVGEKDLFGASARKIVPGTSITATMEITNNGAVAFGYYLQLVPVTGSNEDLLKQIEVSVTGDVSDNGVLNDGLSLGSETQFIGEVLVGKTATFDVNVLFKNILIEGENNKAQGKNVTFTVVVYAVQLIKDV